LEVDGFGEVVSKA
jgi:hypothetical protein